MMLSYLKDFKPSGDSVAARLRSVPAVLLVEWIPAIDELREQYREGTHTGGLCPLCAAAEANTPEGCSRCPWYTFEQGCGNSEPSARNRSPARRIRELSEWRKRINRELKRRGV